MTSEATAGQMPDVYGQVHPLETPELLAAKRSEMEVELDQIPLEEKQDWMQAQTKCDESLVGDDFKLKFLRCEVFNADVSTFCMCGSSVGVYPYGRLHLVHDALVVHVLVVHVLVVHVLVVHVLVVHVLVVHVLVHVLYCLST
jgi:hypothetical protein